MQNRVDIHIDADGLPLDLLWANRLPLVDTGVDCVRILRRHLPKRIFDDDRCIVAYGDCCQRGCPPAWRTDRGLRRQRDGLHVLADRRLDERMWRRRGDAPSRRHE